MSALDEIREFAEQTPCHNSEMHKQCTRQDRDRLLAAVEAVLAVCEDPGGPDSWSHTFQGRHGVFADDVRAAITTALEAKP